MHKKLRQRRGGGHPAATQHNLNHTPYTLHPKAAKASTEDAHEEAHSLFTDRIDAEPGVGVGIHADRGVRALSTSGISGQIGRKARKEGWREETEERERERREKVMAQPAVDCQTKAPVVLTIVRNAA